MRRTRLCTPINPEVLVIGVDIAKNEHVAVASAGDGRLSKAQRFKADAVGFAAFLAFAEEQVKRFGAKSWIVALEPTGHYGLTFVTWLLRRGITVHSVKPLQTSRAKEMFDGAPRKTDAKDAALIATLCRQGAAGPYRVPTGAFAELRVLTRQRQQLVVRRGETVNRVHRHVDVMFPELRFVFPDLLKATPRWVLLHVPTPAEVLAMSEEELAAGLRKVGRGRARSSLAQELRKAAETSTGILEGLRAHRQALAQLLAELQHVLEQIAKIEGEMEQQLAEVPYAAALRTVPRLGVVTIASLLGEFGDLRGYDVACKLVKMAGLDLVEQSSGAHKGQRHISKRGRSYARQILYMAALRLGAGFLAEVRRRAVEGRKAQPTKVAVANMVRLLRILHAMARDGKPFDPTRFASTEAQAA